MRNNNFKRAIPFSTLVFLCGSIAFCLIAINEIGFTLSMALTWLATIAIGFLGAVLRRKQLMAINTHWQEISNLAGLWALGMPLGIASTIISHDVITLVLVNSVATLLSPAYLMGAFVALKLPEPTRA